MGADFPRLETERLILREMVASDAADVFAVGGDDRVMRFYDMDTFANEERALAFVEAQRTRFESQRGVRWESLFAAKVGSSGGPDSLPGRRGGPRSGMS